MAVDSTIISNLVTALRNKFELKANKVDNMSGEYNGEEYATVRAIKNYITTTVSNFVTLNDLSEVAENGDYNDLSNKPNVITTSNTSGLVKNDGTIDTTQYLSEHQDISGKENVSNKVNSLSGDSTNTQYPSAKAVYDSLLNKANRSELPSKVSDLTNDTGFITSANIPTKVSAFTNDSGYLTDLSPANVTLEEQATAEQGYLKTYVIKQGGTALSTKINIPKDFLVKSASVQTVSTANTPVTGYNVGDKYLDFVINTKDDSGSDEHIYVNVKDLIDTYTNGAGLTLSNNEFSIGTGAVTKSMLASAVQTSIDAFSLSPAAGISQDDITKWNAAGSSNLTIKNVDDEIEAYIEALTTALNN